MQDTAPDARRPDDAQPARPALPPDPVAYDHPRAEIARAKGLAAPYIEGGRDPHPEDGLREERRLLRVLLVMVVVVALAGFVLGAIGMLITELR